MSKNEKKNRKITKRTIFIWILSLIVVVSCMVCWWISASNSVQDEELLEHLFLAGHDIDSSYSDTTDEDNSGTDESDSGAVTDEHTLKQLQNNLAALGFGYDANNLYAYNYDNYEEQLEKWDKSAYDNDNLSYRSTPEKFYMWFNDVSEEDRPEYALEVESEITINEPRLDEEIYNNGRKLVDKQRVDLDICVYVDMYFRIDKNGDGDFESSEDEIKKATFTHREPFYNVTTNEEEACKVEVMNEAKEKCKNSTEWGELEAERKDYEEKYKKWVEYRDERNKWLQEQGDDKYFEAKSIEDVSDNAYREFWLNVARKALGLEDKTDREMIDWLGRQAVDEDGNPIEEYNNILDKVVISGEEYEPKDPSDYNGDNSGNDGTGSGGTGSDGTGSGGTGGDGTGSGGTGGDGTGSGGTGSDGTGSGNTGSDNKEDDGTLGEDGSDDYETPGDGKDTVAAKFSSVSLTYPTGNGSYSKGQKVQIKVTFDKNIYGTIEGTKVDEDSAPKLLIKFSENPDKVKEMIFESSGGSSIIYSYIIEEEDNGTIILADGNNFDGVLYNQSGIATIIKNVENLSGASNITIDNKAPEIQRIETISEQGTYETGKEIKIKVTFNEAVYTAKNKIPIVLTTAPVLKISFGSGEAKAATFETCSEKDKTITYKYVITEEDKGKLKIDVNNVFDGTKEICDASGNSIKFTKGVELTGTEIIVNPTVSRIDIDKDKLTLDLKDKEENQELTSTLEATLVGFEEGTAITWSSANIDVATVDTNGVVTAKKVGQAIILARVLKDGKVEAEAKCLIAIVDTTKGETKIQIPNVQNNKIEIDKNGTNEMTLSGEVVKIDKDGNVIEKTSQNITYISKDENIAIVEDGKVIGVTPGKTTIIAKADDGTETEIDVVITNSSKTEIEPTDIIMELSKATIDSSKTKEIVLDYSIEPQNSNTNNKVTFTSSNEDIATVDENGKVTIKGEGTVVITVITENGKKAYTTINSIDISKNETLKDAQEGDYNIDESVDAVDILVLLRHIAASKSSEIAEKHQEWIILDDKYYLLDVNKDGKIDVSDVLRVQRHIAASKSETIANKHKDWKLN